MAWTNESALIISWWCGGLGIFLDARSIPHWPGTSSGCSLRDSVTIPWVMNFYLENFTLKFDGLHASCNIISWSHYSFCFGKQYVCWWASNNHWSNHVKWMFDLGSIARLLSRPSCHVALQWTSQTPSLLPIDSWRVYSKVVCQCGLSVPFFSLIWKQMQKIWNPIFLRWRQHRAFCVLRQEQTSVRHLSGMSEC